MDPKSREDIRKYYASFVDKYGHNFRALNHKSAKQQERVYSLLAAIEPISVNSSMLDVGCGLGYLCDFMRSHGWQGAYLGIDICPEMISSAQSRLPNEHFKCLDILTDKPTEQFDYVFCGATIQHKRKFDDATIYYRQMVSYMFRLAKKGLAFDVFSDRVDFREDVNLYVSPMELLQFCYTFTTRIIIRNDYSPFQIMVYMYKEESRDDFNCYSTWTCPSPKIINPTP